MTSAPKCGPWGILCLSFVLAGCAGAGIHLESKGGGPELAAGPTFAVDSAAGDPAARPDPALVAAVTHHLQDHGMVEANGSGARILVEVTYTDRPVRVGDYIVAGDPKAASQDGGWLTAPTRPGLWTSSHARVCSLAVRLSVPATAQELYRVRAEMRAPRQGCGSVAEPLANAALRQIPLPARR